MHKSQKHTLWKFWWEDNTYFTIGKANTLRVDLIRIPLIFDSWTKMYTGEKYFGEEKMMCKWEIQLFLLPVRWSRPQVSDTLVKINNVTPWLTFHWNCKSQGKKKKEKENRRACCWCRMAWNCSFLLLKAFASQCTLTIFFSNAL